MSVEELLPCPFCGRPANTFNYDGALQATCHGSFKDCAGSDVVAPVTMWNRRTPPAMSADHIGDAQGWRDIATAPRDGREFQAWWKGQWQPRARFDPEFGSFQLWGRTDYDTEGWETFAIDGHWMPLPPPPSAHLAPIKPSADTGELREKVAREIRDWPFPINQHEGCLELADAILDLIQSERRGPRVSILSTKFYGDNANGQPVFSGHADGVTNITLHGWTCFGPDEAGQKALAGFQSERAG